MPAVSKARTPSIAQLARELGYASKPTLLRHLARIDELGPQIDAGLVYPEDWVVFRVTGYRPDIDAPALIPGGALLGDLSALGESISESAGLTMDDIPGDHETIDSLSSRWGVSRKSIERYRRLGLIARRVDLGSGRRRVVFLRETVEWFESMNADRLGRAARFDRIGQAELARFDRWARVYRARLGWSCSQCAARIAERSGHSHEGVRRALLRLDAARGHTVFDEAGPAGDREGRLVVRATMRGIEPGTIAKRSGRRTGAMSRAGLLARLRLLRSLGLADASFDEARLAELLDSGPVRDAAWFAGERDLSGLIDRMRVRVPSVVYEERMLAGAVALLRRRCGRGIARLDARSLSAPAIDRIETDLRLITVLKANLLRGQLSLVLSGIESQLGGGIDTLSPGRAGHLILGGIRAAAGAIDRFDPDSGGRIAAPIGLAVNRFAVAQPDVAQPVDAGKASRRISAGYPISDWTRTVSVWQGWLMPDARIAGVLDRLEEGDRRVLSMRFGFGADRPLTRAGVARELGTTVVHAARFERSALRRALAMVRGG